MTLARRRQYPSGGDNYLLVCPQRRKLPPRISEDKHASGDRNTPEGLASRECAVGAGCDDQVVPGRVAVGRADSSLQAAEQQQQPRQHTTGAGHVSTSPVNRSVVISNYPKYRCVVLSCVADMRLLCMNFRDSECLTEFLQCGKNNES